MNKKNWLKKAGAILLAICMVAGALQYVPHVSKAATTDEVGAQLQAAGYTRVTPSNFGLNGTYTGTTRGTGYGNSLHMTYLDMDVSFESVTNGNTHIRYAIDDADNGIFICGYPSGNFMIKHTSNTAEHYAGTGAIQNVYGVGETNVNVKETFNLKLAVKYESATATSGTVTYSFWINDALVAENHTFTATGLGQNMGIFVGNTNNSITVGTPGEEAQAEDVDALMQAAGYTRVTPGDFGLNGTHTGLKRGNEYNKSLHMTYLDMDVSFEKVTNGNSHIRFAMDGDDNGIFICGYPSGNFVVRHSSLAEGPYIYGPSVTKVNLKETFNFKLAVKFASATATSGTLTYSFWIDNVPIAKNVTVTVNGYGNNMGVFVGNSGDSITVSSPAGEEPEVQPEDVDALMAEAGYTRVTPGTFGLNGKYTGTTRGQEPNQSLHMTYLDMDVTYHQVTNSNTCIRFAIDSNDRGIIIGGFTKSGNLMVRHTNEAESSSNVHGPSVTNVDLKNSETFNLKLAVKFASATATSGTITYSLWVNNVPIVKNGTTSADSFGQNMGVLIGTSGDAITVSTPTWTPEQYGYERITFEDFGIANGSYYPNVVPLDHYTGTYSGSLNNKYLDADLAFSVNSGNTCIRYASADGWTGININASSSGLILSATSGGSRTFSFAEMGIDSTKGLKETFNLKLATKISGSDITCAVWVNDKEVGQYTFTSVSGTGTTVGIYPHNGVVTIGATVVKTFATEAYDLDTDGNYLVTGTEVKVYKNGTLQSGVTSGSVLSSGGTYTIERFDNAVKSTQTICLYKLGDVDGNGQAQIADGDGSDLTALQNLLSGKTNEYKAETAADFAADLDNDGNVGTTDLKLMQAIRSGSKTLANVKATYHVPAVSYEYLGGDEVMPIFGFYGPYRSYNSDGTVINDFITDKIFSVIKESGINMISETSRVIEPQSGNTSVLDAMELAQKYGLGYYADDTRLNTEIQWIDGADTDKTGTAVLDNTTLAGYLTVYSHYENYLGIHVMDEPCPNEEPDDWVRTVENVDGVSTLLNSFANHHGHINANPNYYGSDFIDFSKASNYESYLTDIAEDCDVPMLCFDYYPFEHRDEANSRYFQQIVSVRKVADNNNIPFWGYVQAGGNHFNNSSTQLPSEAETYWNVNTLLAMGAKGIGWFTALQPDGMPDTVGIVKQNGEKTNYFTAVQNINKQIAAVDEVLMKAKSTGVIATGTAKADVPDSVELTKTDMLSSIAASNSKGILVGCFDYRETEAFYVVNYNVNAAQTATLTFNGTYDYRLVMDGVTYFGTGSAVTQSIPAGKAILVVLEDRMVQVNDISEYRSTTASLNKSPDAEPGYEFAGWYDAAGKPIAASKTSGTAYAKYVDANVMSVSAQIKANTTASSETTDIRFYTTVDSLKYQEVGFYITPEGMTEQKKTTNKVYDNLYKRGTTSVDTEISKTAISTQSLYFNAFTYVDVKNKNFDKTFTVKAFWTTLDGTTVYGDTVVKSISMGIQ